MGKVILKDFEINHSILEPSRSSDYDYDPSHPERRFYSTFFHKAEFRDPVIQNVVTTLYFPTEVAMCIIESINRLSDNLGLDNNNPDIPSRSIILTVRGIYVNNNMMPSLMVMGRINDVIRCTIITNGIQEFIFTLDSRESESLALELDDITAYRILNA